SEVAVDLQGIAAYQEDRVRSVEDVAEGQQSFIECEERSRLGTASVVVRDDEEKRQHSRGQPLRCPLQDGPATGQGKDAHAGERHEDNTLAKEIRRAWPLSGDDQGGHREDTEHRQPPERALPQPVFPPEAPISIENDPTTCQDSGGDETEHEPPG